MSIHGKLINETHQEYKSLFTRAMTLLYVLEQMCQEAIYIYINIRVTP